MSYKSGCCCSSGGRAGLGDVIRDPSLDPITLTRSITRLHLGFQSTLQKLPSGNAFLADRARAIQSWFNNTHADMARRDYYNARIKVNVLEQMVPDFGRSVAEATMGGGEALKKAEAGSSWWNQILAATGLIPQGTIYRPESKTADAIEFSGWALALAAGAAGLLVLSLAMRR